MPVRRSLHTVSGHRTLAVFLRVTAVLACLQRIDAGRYAAPSTAAQHDSLGYKYEGKVEFVQGVAPTRPKVRLDTASSKPHAASRGPQVHHTILIKPDGSKYSKRLAVHETEAAVQQAMATSFPGMRPREQEQELGWEVSALRNVSASRRRLAQAGQIVISSTGNDLSCEGCDTTDTRTQVNPTTVYPFTAVGQLLGQMENTPNSFLECSGTLIGRRHVITAAHCVFDINSAHQYVEALNFSPALNGRNAPYGSLGWKQMRVLRQFELQENYTSEAMNYDFALITLSELASTGTGYLAMFQPPNSGSRTTDIKTAGYPGEKPSGTMWTSSCDDVVLDYSGSGPPSFSRLSQCTGGGCSNIAQHNCLSSDGQSGSGMWDVTNALRIILSGKVATSGGNDFNVGTLINPFVYNTIAQWYNEDGGDGSNTSLPLTPVPGTPGGQRSNSGLTNLSISTPWVVAVIAAGGGLVLIAIAVWIWSCCQRRRRVAGPRKGAAQPQGVWPGQRSGQGQGQFMQGRQGPVQGAPHHPGVGPQRGYPHQPAPGPGPAPQGVVYDDRSGQFMVNGQPYGHYPYR